VSSFSIVILLYMCGSRYHILLDQIIAIKKITSAIKFDNHLCHYNIIF